MARINAGKYRHIVTFQRLKEDAQNSYGETPIHGDLNWEDAFNARVGIFPISGREALTEEVIRGEISHRIQLRYMAGIDNTMRIKFGERIFEIISPPVNQYEQNHELHLICKERNVIPTEVWNIGTS
jgi:SPP1 family predicted phage head-tail adaptor